MQKSRLTNLELYSEDGIYYLKAEYEVEDEHRLEKYTFPKLYLPIGDRFSVYDRCGFQPKIEFGCLELDALKHDGYIFKIEILKEYPQKMTLEEIEKKLGYKVELVSGK